MRTLRTLAAGLLRGPACLAGGGWHPPATRTSRMDLAIYGVLAFFGVGLLELVWVVVRSALAIDPADVPVMAGAIGALVVGAGVAIYLIQRDVG